MKMKNIIYISVCVLIGLTGLKAQIFVDGSNTSGTENGNSWSTAYNTIQEGINAAYNNGGGEVWVASGTYYIYETSTANTLSLKEGVYLYGGFAGNETLLSERNWTQNVTIIDGHQYSGSTTRVQHVVSAKMTTSFWNDGLIDGFTITGGYIELGGLKGISATSPDAIVSSNGDGAGAGLLLFQAAPDVSNCIITGNSAGKAGGIYCMVTTEWPITTTNPASTFTNVTVSENHATMRGGGMQCDLDSHPTLIGCRFENNTCDAKGGGLYNDFFCSPVLINCLFTGNTAMRAGAMGNDGSSSPTLVNCTITDNFTTDVGAGLYTGSYNPDDAGANEPVLINCIVWGNDTQWGGPADLRVWAMNYYFIEYSCIGSGFTSFGSGNILSNPLFTDPQNGDYSLQAGSPCIDAGTTTNAPLDDINGLSRDSNPDIGAFEFMATGIEITKNQEALIAYPNPAKHEIFFSGLKPGETLYIFDTNGRAISVAQDLGTSLKLNISSLPSGIYLAKLTSGKTTRFVKN